MELLHRGDLDVPQQAREVVDVPRELDALVLDAMRFHEEMEAALMRHLQCAGEQR